MIHLLHRQQFADARLALEMAEAGTGSAEAFRDAVANMDMIANYRRFANLCGRECQALSLHHKKEDYGLFPQLRGISEGVSRVIDRLMEEHRVIAGLIDNLFESAVALVNDPSPENFGVSRAAFETLERVVYSHFGYEEAELRETIGVTAAPV